MKNNDTRPITVIVVSPITEPSSFDLLNINKTNKIFESADNECFQAY